MFFLEFYFYTYQIGCISSCRTPSILGSPLWVEALIRGKGEWVIGCHIQTGMLDIDFLQPRLWQIIA